ncbi:MAG: hypothetical protein NW216_05655 [Hyphomicrobium sp.]|nr:hypothetical protein [Hyphomicrobium sp.]
MAALRFISGLFALIAVIALASDLTPVLELGAAFQPKTVAEHWGQVSPNTLASARQSFESGWTNSLGLGTAVEWLVLGVPTFALTGALAIAAGFVGRRRREVRVFVN